MRLSNLLLLLSQLLVIPFSLLLLPGAGAMGLRVAAEEAAYYGTVERRAQFKKKKCKKKCGRTLRRRVSKGFKKVCVKACIKPNKRNLCFNGLTLKKRCSKTKCRNVRRRRRGRVVTKKMCVTVDTEFNPTPAPTTPPPAVASSQSLA